MNSRRSAILSAAALVAAPLYAKSTPLVRYTASTAPDALTRRILSHSLSSFHSGAQSQADATEQVRRNLPQIIEQNLARLNGPRIAALLGGLTASELQALAQVYATNVHNSGRSPLLYDLLAERLDAVRIGRLSRYMGFAPLYEAIWRVAPQKSADFQQNSSPHFAAPIPGAALQTAPGRKPVRFRQTQTAPNVGMTVTEIYLNYRTAPIGSLTAAGAAYETTMYAARNFGIAWGTGWAIGTGISSLLQTYAPSVHDSLGASLFNMVNVITNIFSSGSPSDIGSMQESVSWDFALSGFGPIFADTGGDYGAVAEWNGNYGGGGCGLSPDGCPILL